MVNQDREVTLIAGSDFGFSDLASNGFADGNGRLARFNRPWGIAVNQNATELLVSEDAGARVRRIAWPVGDPNSVDFRLLLPLCEGNGERWHHFAVTNRAANSQNNQPAQTVIYFDGEQYGLQENTESLDLSTTKLQFGGQLPSVDRWGTTNSAPFSGAISDVRIFKRVLSQSEAMALTQVPPGFLPSIDERTMTYNPSTKTYEWLCLKGFTGPAVELRLSPITNGWVWSRAQGYGCVPVAVASSAATPVNPAIIGGASVLLLLLAGMALYVVLTRLRVQRQLEALTAKTTLASRAMDRARLLALQATP